MRFNSSLLCGLLSLCYVHAQSVRTYVPEMGEHSARGIPASFEMTGPLPPLEWERFDWR